MTTTCTFFMHLRTTTAWMTLSPNERHQFTESTLMPLLAKSPGVSLRYFDTHAFSPTVTDIAVWETADISAFHSLMAELRETDFWGTFYEVLDIFPAVEHQLLDHSH